MRKMENTNFEQSNIEYVQFWLLNPFMDPDNPNYDGGDLYFNFGEISEDILKDGKKSYENGIPSGTTATAFSPGNTCTNGHVVTFLWRANCEPLPEGTSSLAGQFKNSYYTSAVAWADTTGLLEDTGAAFDPASMSPRANIVTYLYRNLTK